MELILSVCWNRKIIIEINDSLSRNLIKIMLEVWRAACEVLARSPGTSGCRGHEKYLTIQSFRQLITVIYAIYSSHKKENNP